MLLRQVTKTTNEESERKRCLGCATCPKTAHIQSGEINTSEVSKEKCNTDTKAKDELLHQLNAKVQVINSLQSNASTATVRKPSTPDPRNQSTCQCPTNSRQLRKGRQHGCPNCVASSRTDCNHCFACGEEGHCAVGCLKRSKPSGNGPWSWQGGQAVTNSNVKSHPDNHRPVVSPPLADSKSPPQWVAKLLGDKCLLKCNLNGYTMTALQDSVAQVSIIDCS